MFKSLKEFLREGLIKYKVLKSEPPLLALLDSEDKWCQGNNALDKFNKVVSSESPEAVKWCLIGATIKAYSNNKTPYIIGDVLNKLRNCLEPKGSDIALAFWNDDKKRTFKEVRSLIKKAGV